MANDGRQRGSNPCAPHCVEGVPPTPSVISSVAFNQLSFGHLSQSPPLSSTHFIPPFFIHTCHHQNTHSAVPAALAPSRQTSHPCASLPVIPQPSHPPPSIPFIVSLPPTTTIFNAPRHIAIRLLHILTFFRSIPPCWYPSRITIYNLYTAPCHI